MDIRALSKGNVGISQYLSMRGNKRLWFKDDLTLALNDYTSRVLIVRFLESRDYEGWREYNVLLEFKKIADKPDYLREVFKGLADFMGYLKEYTDNNTTIGIQEIETARPESYYILIYIIKEYERE